MTVGGSTSGMETSASMKGLRRLRVFASHQATGMPISSKMSVVTKASLNERVKGVQSIIESIPIRTKDRTGLGREQENEKSPRRIIVS